MTVAKEEEEEKRERRKKEKKSERSWVELVLPSEQKRKERALLIQVEKKKNERIYVRTYVYRKQLGCSLHGWFVHQGTFVQTGHVRTKSDEVCFTAWPSYSCRWTGLREGGLFGGGGGLPTFVPRAFDRSPRLLNNEARPGSSHGRRKRIKFAIDIVK